MRTLRELKVGDDGYLRCGCYVVVINTVAPRGTIGVEVVTVRPCRPADAGVNKWQPHLKGRCTWRSETVVLDSFAGMLQEMFGDHE